jgi:hypothetical protein
LVFCVLSLVTQPVQLGGVVAVVRVFSAERMQLGAFESGVAGQVLGPAGAVVLGGAATLAVAASWGGLFPALRHVDGFPAAVDADS